MTSAEDGGGHGHGLYVGDRGRATEETNVGRERGFETGLALAALERLDQSSLLTADVGTWKKSAKIAEKQISNME